jgi:hypothetical protein
MRETLTGFYRFNIVCYDEEGMNEIEYLYDNYVKPQLTDKQEGYPASLWLLFIEMKLVKKFLKIFFMF